MSQKEAVDGKTANITAAQWSLLSEKKIYFGHQSVGMNIIEGINDLMQEQPGVKLRVIESDSPSVLEKPAFEHSHIGKNYDPISKLDAFYEKMERGIGMHADFALMKFCYVDFSADTDLEKVFQKYKDILSLLQQKYPNTIFIHVTVPLTTVETGPKAFVKKILGRPVDGYTDNIKRNAFNDMLRKEYTGKVPIFDLAGIESTTPEGSSVTFSADGSPYAALNPQYTSDGGHLNKTGRKEAARQLLLLLTRLL